MKRRVRRARVQWCVADCLITTFSVMACDGVSWRRDNERVKHAGSASNSSGDSSWQSATTCGISSVRQCVPAPRLPAINVINSFVARHAVCMCFDALAGIFQSATETRNSCEVRLGVAIFVLGRSPMKLIASGNDDFWCRLLSQLQFGTELLDW